ncbi:nucleotidyltransferase [Clostridium perfringens]|uniref:nucleotidyltransferase n=1 Tax=Clostridium perfringens TaxID=1502 RepID=UPI003B0077A4
MNITGIITEYNPFHLGHELHLKSSKEITNCDGVICVMSGNFVQRGLPALTDKWTRTKMALEAGVDLVVELPTLFATSSAEFFASGAVSLLNSLNVVNNICFGSECGDIDLIKKLSEIIINEPPIFKEYLKDYLKEGLPFPKARSEALMKYLDDNNYKIDFSYLEKVLNSSNNILAIEYCKSLYKLQSSIKPFTIQRLGADYNDEELSKNEIASASAIRKSIYTSNMEEILDFMPEYSYNLLKNTSFSDLDKMFDLVKYAIVSNPNVLKEIPEASEGIDNKIIQNIGKANSLDELINLCKSKRYSYTRLNRILCHVLLNVNKDLLSLRKSSPNYVRILGFNNKGREILKEIKKNSEINIVNKLSKAKADPLLEFDIKATNIYSFLNPSVKINSDYLISPIIFR